jgi:hypothetical protein
MISSISLKVKKMRSSLESHFPFWAYGSFAAWMASATVLTPLGW